MAEVKVLIEGYIYHGSGIACSTCTLIRDSDKKIIVDPGTVKDQKEIILALKKEGLTTNDIDIVCVTHSHLDHYRNIGLFPKAKSLDYWGFWNKDRLNFNVKSRRFSKDIEILMTPGHNYDGITLLVKTKKGTIAICGDIFWRKNYPKKDIYAFNHERLIEDRKKLQSIADFIIPGHGRMFATKKELTDK